MAEFILSLPIILLAMLVTRTAPGPLIVFFPVAMLMQFILMYGIGLLVSSGVAVIPDLARIVRIVMRALFYLSPVLYSVSKIPDHIQGLASLNPMVGILGLYRIGFWSGEIENPLNYVVSFAVGIAFVIAGLVVFRRLEPRILKEA
jgi:ABC-2 type transport system permease protein